jgi:hypothetical protein
MCAHLSTPKPAHPTTVGFVAVQGPRNVLQSLRPNGGLPQLEQPRSTKPRTSNVTVQIQPITDAYGMSGSAAKGSLKPVAFALASAKTSGVPPRGRPV